MKAWQGLLVLIASFALLPFLGISLHHSFDYEDAARCSVSTTNSTKCVSYVSAVITEPQEVTEETSCYYNCYSHTEYVITAKTENAEIVEIAIGESRTDLMPAIGAELLRWNGHYIGIQNSERLSYVYGWHPHLLKTLLVVCIVAILLTCAVVCCMLLTIVVGSECYVSANLEKAKPKKAKKVLLAIYKYMIRPLMLPAALVTQLMPEQLKKWLLVAYLTAMGMALLFAIIATFAMHMI